MMILFVRGFRRDGLWTERALSWLAAPPILVFALVSAWSSQRILYHWAAPGYLMLFPSLGAAISDRLDRAWIRRLLAGSATLVLASVTVIATQIQFDWLGGRMAAAMRTDPTAEGLDWTSIRDDLLARGLLPPGTVAAAFNWRDAGKIGHALGLDVTMLCLSTDSRQFGFANPSRNFSGKDVLLLSLSPPERAITEARGWFRAVEMLPSSSVRLNARILQAVTVIRGQGLLPRP